MPYAVNIADLVSMDTAPFPGSAAIKMLLGSHLNPDGDLAVVCEPNRFDGLGARLDCPEEQAVSIVKLIRFKLRKDQLQIYYSKSGSGSWRRV